MSTAEDIKLLPSVEAQLGLPEIPDPDPEAVPRDGYGRYFLNGKSYTRASTWAKLADDSTGLEKWSKARVVEGIQIDPELLMEGEGSLREPKHVVEEAEERGGGWESARLGTAMHSVIEAVVSEKVKADDVPKDLVVANTRGPGTSHIIEKCRERVSVFLTKLASFDLHPDAECCEMVLSGDGYGGMCDGTANNYLWDLKTGKSVDHGPQFAVQLGLYAHADSTWHRAESGTWVPAPMHRVSDDLGLIIHLPIAGAPRCEIHTVDLRAGWNTYNEILRSLKAWRSNRRLMRPADPDWFLSLDIGPDVILKLYNSLGAGGYQDDVISAWPDGLVGPRLATQMTGPELLVAYDVLETVKSRVGLA